MLCVYFLWIDDKCDACGAFRQPVDRTKVNERREKKLYPRYSAMSTDNRFYGNIQINMNNFFLYYCYYFE